MVYMDYNATSPMHPEANRIMKKWLDHCGGNASANHHLGREARAALESAREAVASLLKAFAHQVVFTSGGTESNNLAILGILGRLNPSEKILCSSIEHPSVRRVFDHLQQLGYCVRQIPVTSSGIVNLKELEKELDSNTGLVSVMAANNETGIVQPVQEIGRLCKQHHILFHCDAAQLIGRLPVPWTAEEYPDVITCSGHKFGASQGVGVLVDRSKGKIGNVFWGGSQEHRLRPGTENIAAITGLGALAPVIEKELDVQVQRLTTMRDHLEKGILSLNSDFHAYGQNKERLPNTTLISFSGHNGMTLASQLDQNGLVVGTGAACSSNAIEPSHVLAAMNVPARQAISTLRFSLGWNTTSSDIDHALEIIGNQV